jgi:hypothetical protein
MSVLDLRVRDLHTGVSSLQSLPTEEAAVTWLAARPRFVEVLGVAVPNLDAAVNARLRAAMRPLDDEEKALMKKLDDAIEAVARERDEERRKKEQEAAVAHKQAMLTADPNRLMEVHWNYDTGFSLTDAADPRHITDDIKAAVLAWVRERDEWVENRGQIVGDAKVTLWPGPIPPAEKGERVKRGTFIPVTAPPKKAD